VTNGNVMLRGARRQNMYTMQTCSDAFDTRPMSILADNAVMSQVFS